MDSDVWHVYLNNALIISVKLRLEYLKSTFFCDGCQKSHHGLLI